MTPSTCDHLYEDRLGNQVQVTMNVTGRGKGTYSVLIVDPEDGHRIDAYGLASRAALDYTAKQKGWVKR